MKQKKMLFFYFYLPSVVGGPPVGFNACGMWCPNIWVVKLFDPNCSGALSACRLKSLNVLGAILVVVVCCINNYLLKTVTLLQDLVYYKIVKPR